MIMAGSREAVMAAVQLIDIHGTRMYDLAYRHVGEEQLRQARLGPESIYTGLQIGDRVKVAYLMNVATAVERL